MTVLEGKWDCAQCMQKGIPGSKAECPNCGSSHDPTLDPSENWYLPSDARVVTDPEEMKAANAGPRWNCGTCGKSNSDDDTACLNCGKPRDADDVVNPVYTYVDGVEVKNETLSTGEDVIDDRTAATLQWADKLQATEDGPVTLPSRSFESHEIPREGVSPYDDDRPQDAPRRSSVQDVIRTPEKGGNLAVLDKVLALPRNIGKQGAIILGAAVAVLMVIMGGIWFHSNFIKTQTVDLTVRSLSWERQVEVEELRTLTQEDWTVPYDGRVIGQRREVRSYRQVLDHYETKYRTVSERKVSGSHTERYVCGSRTVNKGNGYYTSENTYCNRTVTDYTTVNRQEPYQSPVYRNEPVYDTKYTFQVDRWVTDRYDRASGTSNPYWPTPKLGGSKERLGSRTEKYSVVLVDVQNRTSEHTTGESSWSHLAEGQKLRGEQARSGKVRKVYWP